MGAFRVRCNSADVGSLWWAGQAPASTLLLCLVSAVVSGRSHVGGSSGARRRSCSWRVPSLVMVKPRLARSRSAQTRLRQLTSQLRRPVTFTRRRVCPTVRSMTLLCRIRRWCSRGDRRELVSGPEGPQQPPGRSPTPTATPNRRHSADTQRHIVARRRHDPTRRPVSFQPSQTHAPRSANLLASRGSPDRHRRRWGGLGGGARTGSRGVGAGRCLNPDGVAGRRCGGRL